MIGRKRGNAADEERKKKRQKGEGRGPALEVGVGPWRVDKQRRKILPSKLHERGPAAKLMTRENRPT